MSTLIILGSERSGTNLLRSLLSAHSQIASPPPAPVMSYFQDRAHVYYLQKDHPIPLLEDIRKLLSLKDTPFSWDRVPEKEEILEQVGRKGPIGVMASFYEWYAKEKGASFSLCKEAGLFPYPFLLDRSFQDARFIYLVRDGRDVALSERNSPAKKRPTFLLAERWREEQVLGLNAYGELAPEGKAYFLPYEDLLHDPEGVISKLLQWIGLKYETNMLQYHRDKAQKEEAGSSHLWENIGRPMMKDNSGKFRKELGKGRIKTFEKVAGNVLKKLGYGLEFPHCSGKKVPKAHELYFRVFNKMDRFLKGRHTRQREEGIQRFLRYRQSLVEEREEKGIEGLPINDHRPF